MGWQLWVGSGLRQCQRGDRLRQRPVISTSPRIRPLLSLFTNGCMPWRIEQSVNMQLNIFFAVVALAATSLAQQCYFPSGKVATSDIPCSTSSGSTHCCGKTGICLSNGYCMETSEDSGPLGLYRGSCTDRNWGSSCPQECLGGELGEPSGLPRKQTLTLRRQTMTSQLMRHE